MKNVHMCYMSDRRKIENLKKRTQNEDKQLDFSFTQYTLHA